MADHSDLGFTPATPAANAHADLGWTPAAGPANVLDDPNNKLVGTSNGIPVYRHDHPEGAAGAWDSFLEGTGVKALADIVQGGANATPEAKQKSKETAKALVMGIANEPSRVLNEWRAMLQSRSIPESFYHLAGSVPIFGAPAQQVTDDLENGDYARGFGHAFGLMLPFMLKAVPDKVTLPAAVKSRTNPVMQDAVAYADRQGIPISVGTRTGNKAVQGLEKLLQNDLGSSGVAADAKEATTAALKREGNALADRTLPVPASPEDAGSAVINDLQQTIRNLDSRASNAYDRFRRAEQYPQNIREVQTMTDAQGQPVYESIALPVDMRPVKAALRPIYERYQRMMPIAAQRASEGLRAIENVMREGDFKPASIAETDLGAIKAAARSEMPELRDTSQGLAAKAVMDLDGAIRGAVQNAYWPGYQAGAAPGSVNPALRSLLEGRQFTAEKWDVANTVKSFGRKIEDLEPVQVFNAISWKEDSGINRLREVAQRAPNSMPVVGRAYIEGLLDTATREGDFGHTQQIFSRWEKLGPETKKVMFGHPALIKDLDDFFMLAKKISENPNPSGTATTALVGSHLATFTTAAGLLLHDPIGAAAVAGGGVARLIGNNVIAKILFRPGGARLLTQALTIPAGTPRAAAIAAQLLQLAGDETAKKPQK